MSDNSAAFVKLKRALDEKDGFLEKQLQHAALFLLCYENIKDRVLGHIKTFFWNGLDKGKELYSAEYHKRFTGQKPYDKPLFEALKFLAEVAVLSEQDVAIFKSLKTRRDEIGHRLTEIVIDDSKELISEADLDALVLLSFKLDNGWVREFESTIAPEDYAHLSAEEMAQVRSTMTDLLGILVERVKTPANIVAPPRDTK
jgi:hypothetical protein